MLAFLSFSLALLAVHSSLIVSLSQEQHRAYSQWKAVFAKDYPSGEVETYRLTLWLQNFNRIEAHNANYSAGLASYYVGLNRFSDMPRDEVGSWFYSYPYEIEYQSLCEPSSPPTEEDAALETYYHDLPIAQLDQNALMPCASSWALTASYIVSLIYHQKVRAPKNQLPQIFSPQQALDCTSNSQYASSGCGGGSIYTTWHYYMNVGLVYLSIYPYSGIQSSCGIKDNGSDESVITRLSSCVSVTSYSELSLRSAVAVSPVAVEMSANSFGFLQYAGGVYDGLDCDPEAIDHAVAVTGFDFALDYDSNGLAFNSTFWLLANSFGPWWGEGGNMRIARLPGDTSAGPCGMYTFPSYPLL